MKYTKLGTSDLNVSRICLGTMTWGTQNTEADGHTQMDYALDQGVNFWDTAEIYSVPPNAESYGKTETIIGTWLQKNHKRDQIILASKIAPNMPYIRGGSQPINKQNLLEAVDASLTRLQTDYLDLYQLHWPSNHSHYHFERYWTYTPGPIDKAQILASKLEILETIQQLIKAGKIRNWGLSNESAWGVTQYCQLAEKHNLPKPTTLQNEYSLICRRDDTDVAEACMMEGVAHIPYSPLAMGILSGKHQDPDDKGIGTRFEKDTPAFERYVYRLTPRVRKAVNAYLDLAIKIDIDPCQMALAFCLTRPFIAAPIVGASNMDQLKNNISAIEVTLSEETLETINNINHENPLPY